MLSVYHKTTENLKKWSASLPHLKEFDWLDFKFEKELTYESVNKSIVFLDSKNIEISDGILFNQMNNFQKNMKSKKNDFELIGQSCSLKICDFFAASSNIPSYSEIMKTAQYFFSNSRAQR